MLSKQNQAGKNLTAWTFPTFLRVALPKLLFRRGCNNFCFSGFTECSAPAALSNLVSQYNWDVLNEVEGNWLINWIKQYVCISTFFKLNHQKTAHQSRTAPEISKRNGLVNGCGVPLFAWLVGARRDQRGLEGTTPLGKNILILILATLTKELCPDITFACWIGVVNLKASWGLSIRKLCMTIHEGTRDRFSRGSLAYYRYLNSLWTWSRLWYRELPEMMSLQVIYFDWPERVSHAIFAGNVGQCRGISMVSSLVPSARMGHLGHSTATVKLPDRLEGGMCSNFMIFCSVLGWWVIISFLSFFDAVESEGILSVRGC